MYCTMEESFVRLGYFCFSLRLILMRSDSELQIIYFAIWKKNGSSYAVRYCKIDGVKV